MSFSPILTKEDADKLNTKIQEIIDPRLIVCCNYEPISAPTFSAGEHYRQSIYDLYRFAIDSSWFISQFCRGEYLLNSFGFPIVHPLTQDIESALGKVQALRNWFAHNQNVNNGMIQQERIDHYKDILRTTIGHDEVTSEQDHELLDQMVCTLARSLYDDVSAYLDHLATLPEHDRANMGEKWIDATLHWEIRNTKTEYYLGFLKSFYLYYESHFKTDPSYALKRWIKNMMVHYYQETRKEYGDPIRYARGQLDDIINARGSYAVYPEKKLAQAKQEWTYFLLLFTNTKDLMQNNGNATQYQARFFEYLLPEQLKVTMSHFRNLTLLPQDLLSQDVRYWFRDIIR